jgi:hypothetical protein
MNSKRCEAIENPGIAIVTTTEVTSSFATDKVIDSGISYLINPK